MRPPYDLDQQIMNRVFVGNPNFRSRLFFSLYCLCFPFSFPIDSMSFSLG